MSIGNSFQINLLKQICPLTQSENCANFNEIKKDYTKLADDLIGHLP